ncbi:MAG: hypothetical protein HY233_11630 [Acidobacteriales bacterium]|nr:hypothetical protein [Terriglobales bacterium]
MPYDMTEHRHRFAAWAAARAVQRRWRSAKKEKLRDALEGCGVREFVCSPESRDIDEDRFRQFHRQWCRAVIESLTQQGVADATFGRAAKLVAVYLKVMVVLSAAGDCDLARVVNPPIDRTELQKVAAEVGVDSPHKRLWKTVNWTQLTEENYYSLIDQLRVLIPSSDPFWTLEQYWNVADDS